MVSENSSAALREQMEKVRHDFSQHASAMVAKAKTRLDWQQFVFRHPWGCFSAAVAVGYLRRRGGCERNLRTPHPPEERIRRRPLRRSFPAWRARPCRPRGGSLPARAWRIVTNFVRQWLESRVALRANSPPQSQAAWARPTAERNPMRRG